MTTLVHILMILFGFITFVKEKIKDIKMYHLLVLL